MSLLLSSIDTLATVAASGYDLVLANTTPTNDGKLADSATIQTSILNFILPLVFLAIGAIAIKFLMQRQMTQFFQFAAIAMLVLLLLTNPGILKGVADQIGKLLGG